jgi:hypothetical protein
MHTWATQSTMSRQPGDTVGLGVALLLIEFVVGIRAPTLVADLLDFVFLRPSSTMTNALNNLISIKYLTRIG